MPVSRAARTRATAAGSRRRTKRAERVPSVNDVVDIWWGVDKTYYRGRLTRRHSDDNNFRVLYDDGEMEDINLANEYWKFASDDEPGSANPPDASTEKSEEEQVCEVVLDGSHASKDLEKDKKKTKPKQHKSSTSDPNPAQTSAPNDPLPDDKVKPDITKPSRPLTTSATDVAIPSHLEQPRTAKPSGITKTKKHKKESEKQKKQKKPKKHTPSDKLSSSLKQKKPIPTAKHDPSKHDLSKLVLEPSKHDFKAQQVEKPIEPIAHPATLVEEEDEELEGGNAADDDSDIAGQPIRLKRKPSAANIDKKAPSHHVEEPQFPQSCAPVGRSPRVAIRVPKPKSSKSARSKSTKSKSDHSDLSTANLASSKISKPTNPRSKLSREPSQRLPAQSQSEVATTEVATLTSGPPEIDATVEILAQPDAGRDIQLVSEEPPISAKEKKKKKPLRKTTNSASGSGQSSYLSQPLVSGGAMEGNIPILSAVLPRKDATLTKSADQAQPSVPVRVSIRPPGNLQLKPEEAIMQSREQGAAYASNPNDEASVQRVTPQVAPPFDGNSHFEPPAVARDINPPRQARKRSRSEGQILRGLAARDNPTKRSRAGAASRGGERAPDTDPVYPVTHFSEQNATLTTLVNRRLSPMEKHLRSLSEDFKRVGRLIEEQRRESASLRENMEVWQSEVRKEMEMSSQKVGNYVNGLKSILGNVHTAIHSMAKGNEELLASVLGRGSAPVADRNGGISTGTNTNGAARGEMNGFNVRQAFARQDASYQNNGAGQNMTKPVTLQPRPTGSGEYVGAQPDRQNKSPVQVMQMDDVEPEPVVDPVRSPVGQERYDPGVDHGSHDSDELSVFQMRVTHLVARQVTVWLLETPHEQQYRGMPLTRWAKHTSAGAFLSVSERLSQFQSYTQAHSTLSTSLGNDAVELSWFVRPSDPQNVILARRNYAAWDPPPTDAEWNCEAVLLREVARGFHDAIRQYQRSEESELRAAIIVTKRAADGYLNDGIVPFEVPNPTGGNGQAASEYDVSHGGANRGQAVAHERY